MASMRDINSIATIVGYRKGAIEAATRNSLIFNKLMQKNRVSKWTKGGTRLEYNAHVGQYGAFTAPEDTDITSKITGKKHDVRVYHDWAMLLAAGRLNNVTVALNSGDSALVDLAAEVSPRVFAGIIDQGDSCLSQQLFRADGTGDGALTAYALSYIGSDRYFYGLPSIFKPASSQTSANDVVSPDGTSTYGGLTLGAAPSADDTDNTVWRPLMLQETYPWDGSSATFAGNLQELVTQVTARLDFGLPEMKPDIMLHTQNRWATLLNHVGDKENVYLQPGDNGYSNGNMVLIPGSLFGHLSFGGMIHSFDANMLPLSTGRSIGLCTGAIRFHYIELPPDEIGAMTIKRPGKEKNTPAEMIRFYTQQSMVAGGGKEFMACILGQWELHPKYMAEIRTYA